MCEKLSLTRIFSFLIHSADFTQIYVSEIVEDTADATPSLVASVRCSEEFDCVIRLSVYYSSNLTAEKDVLLAGTSFTRKELLRAVHNKGVLISDMVSEHCPGSKAYIEIMAHMPNVLPDVATVLPTSDPTKTDFPTASSLGFNITSPRSPVNPFKQRYVFYAENNQFEPLIHAEESTWEPRFAALIPAMFMENFTSALVRSINAWNMRYELERKRQGRFRSLKEAIQHGWHSVNVTVHAGNAHVCLFLHIDMICCIRYHVLNKEYTLSALSTSNYTHTLSTMLNE